MAQLTVILLKAWTWGLSFLKSIPWKVWVALIAAALIVTGTLWASGKIENHLDYVQELEDSKSKLTQERDSLILSIKLAQGVNLHNQQVYRESLQQAENARRIADEARVAAELRATRYRNLYNELEAIPQADRQSVDPVVRGVIERLWDDED